MHLHVNIITIRKRENVIVPCIFEPLLELGYKASAAGLFESAACCWFQAFYLVFFFLIGYEPIKYEKEIIFKRCL